MVIQITMDYSRRENNLQDKNIQGMEKSNQGYLWSTTTKRGPDSGVWFQEQQSYKDFKEGGGRWTESRSEEQRAITMPGPGHTKEKGEETPAAG